MGTPRRNPRARRCGLETTAVFVLLAGALACTPEPPPGPDRVILIVADTLRADRVGAYGAKVPTPHMNALAKQGQIFPFVVSSFHMTPPSMGSMFTGLVPSLELGRDNLSLQWTSDTFCGMARFRETADDLCIPEHLDTLAEAMSGAGYWTVGATANSLLFDPHGFSQGFDDWLEVGIKRKKAQGERTQREHAESRTGQALHEALLPRLRARPSDRFFLFAQYLDVHDWFVLGRGYDKSVRLFDEILGELISFLDDEGLLEGSVIVLTSDHGELIGEKHPVKGRGGHLGNPSYEQVLRVPLIVRPAVFDRTDVMIRGDDLRGMLLSVAAGEPIAPPIEGPREHFVSEGKYQTYRFGRYKSMWPRDGGEPALFDLEADPMETANVGAQHPRVLAEHRLRLDELTAELAHGGAAEPKALDEDALERLRALGYLETVEE